MKLAQNTKLAETLLQIMRHPTVRLKKSCDNVWSITGLPENRPKSVPSISSKQLSALIAADWIAKTNGGEFALGAAGRAWLARRAGGADPFRRQHQQTAYQQITTPDNIELDLEVDVSESPLGWLRARKDKLGNPMISQEQFMAGERLRRDFTLGGMTTRTTASWSASSPPRGRKRNGARTNTMADDNDDAIAAKERFFRAIEAIGPELAGILVEVCCYLTGVESAEKKFGWPRRSGKTVLQIALSALARHYGYVHVQRNTGKKEHWGQDGYRPDMFAPGAGQE